MTTGYQRYALAKALEILNDEREEVGDRLDRVLRLLARYRQTLISKTLRGNGPAPNFGPAAMRLFGLG